MSKSADTKPFPLSKTLRDLALLRSSEIDLGALLSPPDNESAALNYVTAASDEVAASVKRSYEFVQEARAAIRLQYRGDAEEQGRKVEDLRSKLEDVLQGLKEE